MSNECLWPGTKQLGTGRVHAKTQRAINPNHESKHTQEQIIRWPDLQTNSHFFFFLVSVTCRYDRTNALSLNSVGGVALAFAVWDISVFAPRRLGAAGQLQPSAWADGGW